MPAESLIDGPPLQTHTEGVSSSWIVPEGRVIFEITVGSDAYPELLEKGSVIHFSHAALKGIQALRDSELIQVVYSVDCFCDSSQNANEKM
jgi:hypothetical protein